MTGVPWELNELPRQLHADPRGDIFGGPPPPRAPRTRKPKAPLEPISERAARVDAGTSTTDLSGMSVSGFGGAEEEGDGPKKVQRGQITALAKMLGALRR